MTTMKATVADIFKGGLSLGVHLTIIQHWSVFFQSCLGATSDSFQ